VITAITTSDVRKANKIWIALGGHILPVRRTGEVRYVHSAFVNTVRANGRRKDTPAVLLSRINQLLRRNAANDGSWTISTKAGAMPCA
jgi:hypothetical protein